MRYQNIPAEEMSSTKQADFSLAVCVIEGRRVCNLNAEFSIWIRNYMIKFIIEVHSHLFNPVSPLASIDDRVDEVLQIDVNIATMEELITFQH